MLEVVLTGCDVGVVAPTFFHYSLSGDTKTRLVRLQTLHFSIIYGFTCSYRGLRLRLVYTKYLTPLAGLWGGGW